MDLTSCQVLSNLVFFNETTLAYESLVFTGRLLLQAVCSLIGCIRLSPYQHWCSILCRVTLFEQQGNALVALTLPIND